MVPPVHCSLSASPRSHCGSDQTYRWSTRASGDVSGSMSGAPVGRNEKPAWAVKASDGSVCEQPGHLRQQGPLVVQVSDPRVQLSNPVCQLILWSRSLTRYGSSSLTRSGSRSLTRSGSRSLTRSGSRSLTRSDPSTNVMDGLSLFYVIALKSSFTVFYDQLLVN